MSQETRVMFYTLSSLMNLAALLRQQGRFEEAEPYLREALQASPRVLGEDHDQTIRATNDLGLVLQKQGKLDEAEQAL